MRLADGRVFACNAFEIVSLPSQPEDLQAGKEARQVNANLFQQIAGEFHSLSLPDRTVAELLWVAHKTENQTFRSRIRLFFVLRAVGSARESVAERLEQTQNVFMNSFANGRFTVNKVEPDGEDFAGTVSAVDCSSVFSVVKSERCNANSGSLGYYCFSDIIPANSEDNFLNLVTALSQTENCAVSFQLVPAKFTAAETVHINEMSAQYAKIAGGFQVEREFYRDVAAGDPYRYFSYYNERIGQPLFRYNILIFGQRAAAAGIAAKVISLLQTGKGKTPPPAPVCVDLASQKINMAAQFIYYPWNVCTAQTSRPAVAGQTSLSILAPALKRMPYLITAEEANCFFRLPLHEKAMTALKSNQGARSSEQFSASVVDKSNIRIGLLKSAEGAQVAIGCPEKAFTKHGLIVGTPGSGKTNFSISLLMQFAKRKIPFLAIEPTKREYRSLIDEVPDLRIFTPGNNDVSPFIINPFIPPKDIRIEQYVPSLASAFKAAFSMPEPLDIIFLKAIRSCYTEYGWKDYSKMGDSDVKVFGLHEFILVFKRLIEKMDYSAEVKGNIKSAGLLRLSNLIEQNSNIYDTINTVPIEDLLKNPTVIELDAIDNAEQKSLLMALLLINICVYTKHNHLGDGNLKNIILIDEAHVLLGNRGSGGDGAKSEETTVSALQNMIAEIRSFGTGIIIADQSPTKVSREVVANTDIKVTFRLVQAAEKSMIIDSTSMDEENARELSRLKVGEAFVYYSGLEEPQLVVTEKIRGDTKLRMNVGNDEIARRNTYWPERRLMLRPFAECALFDTCSEGCDFVIRAKAEYLANKLYLKYRSKIIDAKTLMNHIAYVPKLIEKEIEAEAPADRERMNNCVKVRFMRKAELEGAVSLNQDETNRILTYRG